MSEFIQVREVGLRDGLQLIKTRLPTKIKMEWCKRQVDAGFKEIEITSIVPKETLPQFSDYKEMIKNSNEIKSLSACVLVPNLRGAVLALENDAKKINFVLSASEEHNLLNVNMSTSQSLCGLKEIIAVSKNYSKKKPMQVMVSISTSFGCSISGVISEKKVLSIVEKTLALGVNEINIADTVGYANPKQVKSLIKKIMRINIDTPIIAHFHDTQGFGLANVVAALDEGVKVFDASLRGLGGCPHAPGASGNIATEDCINLLEKMGYSTGINLQKLKSLCGDMTSWLPNELLEGKFFTVATSKI